MEAKDIKVAGEVEEVLVDYTHILNHESVNGNVDVALSLLTVVYSIYDDSDICNDRVDMDETSEDQAEPTS